MTIPRAEALLPQLTRFVHLLLEEIQQGQITDWPDFIEQVRAFYTPERMAQIEHVVPGWDEMASYANQQTLIHVTSVLVALYRLPEYQQATSDQRALMEWVVLFHDVAKIAQRGRHDYTHGFRSAAIAGRALRAIGFPVTDDYTAKIDDWFALTHSASIHRADLGEDAQDNTKLPQIVAGIDRLFGVDAPAGWVIKAVLFHISVVTDPDYPTVAPLTDAEFRRYLTPSSFPILRMMMLVDTDAWNIFDAPESQRQRQQTLDAFERLAPLLSGVSG